MITFAERSAIFAAPLDSQSRISLARRTIESEMSSRLPGRFLASYQPRADLFVVHWQPDGEPCEPIDIARSVSEDIDRQRLETTASPFGYLSVFLRHKRSLQEVR